MHCTAVGSGGPGSVILNTTDGGTTWSPQTPPAAATALNGITCVSDTTCFAAGTHVIGTTDGGSQWNDLGAPTGSTALSAISCISHFTCTAVGGASIVITNGWRCQLGQ